MESVPDPGGGIAGGLLERDGGVSGTEGDTGSMTLVSLLARVALFLFFFMSPRNLFLSCSSHLRWRIAITSSDRSSSSSDSSLTFESNKDHVSFVC